MTTNIRCKGVDLDNIFDPYVEGTSPGLTGLKVAGVDINTRYAPLIYGTAAPVTNINSKVRGTSSFVDLNTLFAAKGTAKYTLPIDGASYTAIASSGGIAPIKLAQATVSVQIGGGHYNIQTSVINNGAQPVINNYQFDIPAGVSKYYVTLTGVSTGTGGSSSDQPAWASIPGAVSTQALVKESNQSNNGTQITSATANLYFGDDSNRVLWSASFSIEAETDISA